jgi:hypothetical protein
MIWRISATVNLPCQSQSIRQSADDSLYIDRLTSKKQFSEIARIIFHMIMLRKICGLSKRPGDDIKSTYASKGSFSIVQ